MTRLSQKSLPEAAASRLRTEARGEAAGTDQRPGGGRGDQTDGARHAKPAGGAGRQSHTQGARRPSDPEHRDGTGAEDEATSYRGRQAAKLKYSAEEFRGHLQSQATEMTARQAGWSALPVPSPQDPLPTQGAEGVLLPRDEM